ncbi:Fur family transcriptional regulator [Ructibacterium gallinarum]|uniref:Transcriptional repressor n=1 Tax=Ructibacterium gallinarum TaxID=2779355 RepID=A0A9D5M1V2_9FIRM|nr:transcriptional repressor [Ructibacterium gallinarum]MBE5039050.1 transcriptional repressor [Ructibacterium gallinarum]
MQPTGITKNSKQRSAILLLLQNTKRHPTADWIYAEVRKELPNISLGTVYRNLAYLTEQGLIQRLDVGEGMDRFDGNVAPHYHLFCEHCKRLLDLDLPYNAELNKKAGTAYSGRILWHSLVFHGICHICSKSEKEKE